jgi:hypothetical protein
MKATTSMVCVVLLFASACHTRTAADPSQEEQAAQEVEDGDQKDDDQKDGDQKDDDQKDADHAKGSKAEASSQARSTGDGAKKGSSEASSSESPKKEKKDGKGDEIDPEDIEVSTSAQGLLKPGAEDRVREKLGVDEGKGMGAALRKFQREHDLPATGMLDHETVIKLGLEPSDIWQQAH